MKLYIYQLEKYGKKKIVEEEIEVVECPKTYKLKNRPCKSWIYGTSIHKNTINRIHTGYRNLCILTEPDINRAAELLSRKCKDDIKRAKARIDSIQKEIEAGNEDLSVIEKWRKAHE